MKTNYLNIVRPQGGLYTVDSLFSVAAAGKLSTKIEVRKQRGDIQALGIIVSGEGHNETELLKSLITLSNNGVSIIEEATLLRYASAYRFGKQVVIPIFIRGGAVINVNIENNSGAVLDLSVVQFFYDPNQQLNIMTIDSTTGLQC